MISGIRTSTTARCLASTMKRRSSSAATRTASLESLSFGLLCRINCFVNDGPTFALVMLLSCNQVVELWPNGNERRIRMEFMANVVTASGMRIFSKRRDQSTPHSDPSVTANESLRSLSTNSGWHCSWDQYFDTLGKHH